KFDRTSDIIYNLIKNDLDNHFQTLDMAIVVNELETFVRKEKLDIAIGKSVVFERGMIIPSPNLKNGEICVPWLSEGEDIINFRSPLINSNGMCVSKNIALPEEILANGEYPEGVIFVSDETHKDIVKRINQDIKKEIEAKNEKLAPESRISISSEELLDENIKYDELSGKELISTVKSENAKLEKLVKKYSLKVSETIPIETEWQRQARDHDGDCIGVAQASLFPNLAAEVIRRNLPENAYTPTIKQAKQSFHHKNGEQWDFEEIAAFMAQVGIVGQVNNHLTTLEALESELEIVAKFGTQNNSQISPESLELVKKLEEHYKKLIEEDKKKNGEVIPEAYRDRIDQIRKLAKELTPNAHKPKEKVDKIFSIQKSIYRDLIDEAAFENQVAVDMFKSSRKPNLDLIKRNRKLLYRNPTYIRAKKDKSMYTKGKVLEAAGYSPVEILIAQANAVYEQAQLHSRPNEQFANLFPDKTYTPRDYNRSLWAKRSFDLLFNEATAASRKQQNEKGPVIKVTTKKGSEIEISNLIEFGHPNAFDPAIFSKGDIDCKLKLEKNDKNKHHKLIVKAPCFKDGEVLRDKNNQIVYRTLGTVCEEVRQKYNLEAGTFTRGLTLALAPGISETFVKQKFQTAKDLARNWRIEAGDRAPSMAAAAYHCCYRGKNIANNRFVWEAFGDLIAQQVKELHLNRLTVTKVTEINKLPLEDWINGQTLDVTVAREKDPQLDDGVEKILLKANGQTFGTISAEGSQLPVNTKAKANIEIEKIATANLTLKSPVNGRSTTLKISKMGEGDFAKHYFNNSDVQIKFEEAPEDPVPAISLNGKKIGILDETSIENLKKHPRGNLYRSGSLKGHLTTVEGRNKHSSYILLKTPTGNVLRFKWTDTKNPPPAYNNTPIDRIRLDLLKPKKTKVQVKAIVNGETYTLGQLIGENLKTFTQLGFQQKEHIGKTYNAKIKSNLTTVKAVIDPSTVEYPATGEYVSPIVPTEPNLFSENTSIDPNAVTADILVNKIAPQIYLQPTLFFVEDRDDWANTNGNIPTLGLSVDLASLDRTVRDLKNNKIEYRVIPSEDPSVAIESDRGYVQVLMKSDTVPYEFREHLEQQFGTPLSAKFDDMTTISQYHRELSKQLTTAEKEDPQRLAKNNLSKTRLSAAQTTNTQTTNTQTASTQTASTQTTNTQTASTQTTNTQSDPAPETIDRFSDTQGTAANNSASKSIEGEILPSVAFANFLETALRKPDLADTYYEDLTQDDINWAIDSYSKFLTIKAKESEQNKDIQQILSASLAKNDISYRELLSGDRDTVNKFLDHITTLSGGYEHILNNNPTLGVVTRDCLSLAALSSFATEYGPESKDSNIALAKASENTFNSKRESIANLYNLKNRRTGKPYSNLKLYLDKAEIYLENNPDVKEKLREQYIPSFLAHIENNRKVQIHKIYSALERTIAFKQTAESKKPYIAVSQRINNYMNSYDAEEFNKIRGYAQIVNQAELKKLVQLALDSNYLDTLLGQKSKQVDDRTVTTSHSIDNSQLKLNKNSTPKIESTTGTKVSQGQNDPNINIGQTTPKPQPEKINPARSLPKFQNFNEKIGTVYFAIKILLHKKLVQENRYKASKRALDRAIEGFGKEKFKNLVQDIAQSNCKGRPPEELEQIASTALDPNFLKEVKQHLQKNQVRKQAPQKAEPGSQTNGSTTTPNSQNWDLVSLKNFDEKIATTYFAIKVLLKRGLVEDRTKYKARLEQMESAFGTHGKQKLKESGASEVAIAYCNQASVDEIKQIANCAFDRDFKEKISKHFKPNNATKKIQATASSTAAIKTAATPTAAIKTPATPTETKIKTSATPPQTKIKAQATPPETKIETSATPPQTKIEAQATPPVESPSAPVPASELNKNLNEIMRSFNININLSEKGEVSIKFNNSPTQKVNDRVPTNINKSPAENVPEESQNSYVSSSN
ncbi:MAG: hypothetical protein ACFBSE_12445, partial [Prochloraceae cyanobacterium]